MLKKSIDMPMLGCAVGSSPTIGSSEVQRRNLSGTGPKHTLCFGVPHSRMIFSNVLVCSTRTKEHIVGRGKKLVASFGKDYCIHGSQEVEPGVICGLWHSWGIPSGPLAYFSPLFVSSQPVPF